MPACGSKGLSLWTTRTAQGSMGAPGEALVSLGTPCIDPMHSCEVPGAPWLLHGRFFEGSPGVLKSSWRSLDVPGGIFWES